MLNRTALARVYADKATAESAGDPEGALGPGGSERGAAPGPISFGPGLERGPRAGHLGTVCRSSQCTDRRVVPAGSA